MNNRNMNALPANVGVTYTDMTAYPPIECGCGDEIPMEMEERLDSCDQLMDGDFRFKCYACGRQADYYLTYTCEANPIQ